MIAKQIGSFEDFNMVMDMDDSVRKRRSLTRFRYQLEDTDQKPRKARRKKDA